MAGAIVGAAILAERIKRKMKELGAVSKETAKKPQELGQPEWFLNTGAAQIHGIRRTEDGRYYIESKDNK